MMLGTGYCCVCGIEFAMPPELNAARQRDGAWFWCPNGHQQKYTGEIEKLKAELAKTLTERDRLLTELCELRVESERTYRCIVAGCDEWRRTKASLRKHLETVHAFAEQAVRALPEHAGPSN